jgi:hypothetical protein
MAENTAYTLTPARGQAASGPMRLARGKIVFPATAIVTTDSITLDVGFQARYVRFVNLTDRVEIEWFEGMAAGDCLKTVAAGTRTHEVAATNGGITVGVRDFSVLQNATLAAILASKTCYWEASD